MPRGDGAARDPFAVLGLTSAADGAAVRRAFRARARETHPDRGGDSQEFMRVNHAYEQLRTPEGRALQARRAREQGDGARRPDGPGVRPTAGGTPRPGPGRPGSTDADGAARIPPHVQDRLVEDFFRSHPDSSAGATAAGRRPRDGGVARGGAGRGRGADGHRRRGRARVAGVAVLVLAAAVALLAPDVPAGVVSWVGSLTG